MPDPDERTDLDFLDPEEAKSKEDTPNEDSPAEVVPAEEFKGVSMQSFSEKPEGETVVNVPETPKPRIHPRISHANDPRYKLRLLSGGRKEWIPKRAFVEEIVREEAAKELVKKKTAESTVEE